MLQKEAEEGEDLVDVIILTHRCIEENANVAIAKIEGLATSSAKVVRIRLEELN
jgi:homoserine dehydrogenase